MSTNSESLKSSWKPERCAMFTGCWFAESLACRARARAAPRNHPTVRALILSCERVQTHSR
eukprot:6561910-Prymnesium_polylepis.1